MLAVFHSNRCTVNWSVPFLLNFLVDFSDFPGEIFLIEIFVILRYKSFEMLGDKFFFRLLIGVKFKGTVEDSSVVKSSNNYSLLHFFTLKFPFF
jgi:hypothetical protein